MFKSLKAKWPSTIVARESVSKFSGGVLRSKTLANHDAMGTGPAGKFYIGRKVVYPVDSLIQWMTTKIK